MTTTEARQCLKELVDAQHEEKRKGKQVTLVYWRLVKNPPIYNALKEFSEGPELSAEGAQQEVQSLFDKLNRRMWEQEVAEWTTTCSASLDSVAASTNQLPVVFGGKYAKDPKSISEQLVQYLAHACTPVYTVSRTDPSILSNVPSHVRHVCKQNLDQRDGGAKEFEQVMQLAISDGCPQDKTLTFYFTLGQHLGENPFQRNMAAADNFCHALLKLKNLGKRFRVVITGTDATLPSTSPDGSIQIKDETYVVPTYKIMMYNYVYAMSKLYQYYRIAQTVATMVGNHNVQLEPTLDKMKRHVEAAGMDGTYHENADNNILQMSELDQISNEWHAIEKTLKDNLKVAHSISICYTPLHGKPWTEKALLEPSPKSFIIQQVVRRMKNAISIQRAARLHLE